MYVAIDETTIKGMGRGNLEKGLSVLDEAFRQVGAQRGYHERGNLGETHFAERFDFEGVFSGWINEGKFYSWQKWPWVEYYIPGDGP